MSGGLGDLKGALFVVATPIGNLGDISARAIEVLRGADIIAAEDTRQTASLCAHVGITAPASIVSLHDHNEASRVPSLVAMVREGKRVVLVSDAGTPLVSDPGFRVVSAMHDAGLRVVPVPGACAVIAALSASGLPSDRFFFEGFLPATASSRRDRLASLREQAGSLVLYEAPHRIAETLHDCVDVLGATRRATLAREITKRFETIRRATLVELRDFVDGDPDQRRGEIVLLIEGAAGRDLQGKSLMPQDDVLRLLAAELPATRAARVASALLNMPRRQLYDRLLELGADAQR